MNKCFKRFMDNSLVVKEATVAVGKNPFQYPYKLGLS